MFDFAKEMYFDVRDLGNKSTRDKSISKMLNAPAIMAGSLKETNTRRLSCDPKKVCDRLKLFLQEKQAGDNSNINNERNVAIADKLIKYKSRSTEQLEFLLVKS